LLLIHHFFQVEKSRGGCRPTGVKGDMGNGRHEFFLGEAVFKGLFEMEFDLFNPVQGNQTGNRDQVLLRGESSGRFQMSPKRKSWVSLANSGATEAKSSMVFCSLLSATFFPPMVK
jgi:hypothetical protein